ncbi:putative F-box domain-containing protein [Rosa chinensis]|uniref:Putative F-box domain-containing protein n=1 Tax=Rosa chinensis TaxID=74649 RepID=A0A2P6S2A3_ROSCH|nr:putative F-box protein At1g47790 [Rosa chinensis]PRQ52795.1 putative F-box domain-containing protein [Rosa chinensis]
MFDSSLAKIVKREVVRLPDEITYEILVRLQIDSLLKCRAVCKWWNSLIKSSTFILTHLKSTLLIQSNNNKDDLLLLHAQREKEGPFGGEFFMLDCDDINDEYTKRCVIPTSDIKAVSPIYEGREINVDQQNFYPVGTCNGLIGLVCHDMKKPISIPIIWNPCVRKFLVLPSPSFSPYKVAFFLYELGYDSHNNDIKLVQIVVPKFQDDQTPCTFQVFSLLRGSWKDLNAPADFKPFPNDLTTVEISGALHWICGKLYTEINESTVIVTFNLSSELFGKMKIPKALKKDSTKKSC